MRKTKFSLLLFISFSLYMFGQKNDDTKIEKAFDFWVGNWEVSWMTPDSTKVIGSNKVVKILDGKVIQENFIDPSRNFKGTSLSVFNSTTKEWHQAWADNNGGFYDFVGEVKQDEKIFIMPEPSADGATYRMIFSEIKENSFVWKWQGIRDGWDEWKTVWKINYKRK